MPDEFLEMFRKGLADAKRQRKSDEIIEFIRMNWKLFCASRRQMDSIIEELEQRNDLSVTALAEALEIPQTVLFKKVKIVDAAKLVLHFKTSELYTLFDSLVRKNTLDGRRPYELCLIAVAGSHTLIITNMTTKRVPGTVQLCLVSDAGNDINVFPAADAAVRLPGLFEPKE